MIAPPERSDARDAAIDALLPLVPEYGWTVAALQRAAGQDADLLFPGGPAEMVEAYIDLADRRMASAAAPLLAGLRLHQRVRALIAERFAQAAPHRDAIRRAFAVLSLPANLAISATCTARTVDAIWHAAGDTSADFSWYTKRAILASVYSATLLFWLGDRSAEGTATLAFLDRRLAGVARIGKLRRRFSKAA
jgi:ubiquinone biosynthesis protein COQ9